MHCMRRGFHPPPYPPFARGGKLASSGPFPPLRRGGCFECLCVVPGSSFTRLKTTLEKYCPQRFVWVHRTGISLSQRDDSHGHLPGSGDIVLISRTSPRIRVGPSEPPVRVLYDQWRFLVVRSGLMLQEEGLCPES